MAAETASDSSEEIAAAAIQLFQNENHKNQPLPADARKGICFAWDGASRMDSMREFRNADAGFRFNSWGNPANLW